jgi:hypothetical protein
MLSFILIEKKLDLIILYSFVSFFFSVGVIEIYFNQNKHVTAYEPIYLNISGTNIFKSDTTTVEGITIPNVQYISTNYYEIEGLINNLNL